MDKHEKMLNKMREIALTNPEKIRIVETNVNAEVQLEFYELMQRIGENEISSDVNSLITKLADATGFENKKRILVTLACIGTVEAFRFLENYLSYCDDEIRKWALLAYQQCQMFLESSLLDESKIYIASGLGGKEHRLRYIFVLAGTSKSDFTDFHKKVLENETEYYLNKHDSIKEELKYSANYAICTALVPLSEDIVSLVQKIIDEVNQYGNFISNSIFVTNEKIVDKEYLDKIFESNENR